MTSNNSLRIRLGGGGGGIGKGDNNTNNDNTNTGWIHTIQNRQTLAQKSQYFEQLQGWQLDQKPSDNHNHPDGDDDDGNNNTASKANNNDNILTLDPPIPSDDVPVVVIVAFLQALEEAGSDSDPPLEQQQQTSNTEDPTNTSSSIEDEFDVERFQQAVASAAESAAASASSSSGGGLLLWNKKNKHQQKKKQVETKIKQRQHYYFYRLWQYFGCSETLLHRYIAPLSGKERLELLEFCMDSHGPLLEQEEDDDNDEEEQENCHPEGGDDNDKDEETVVVVVNGNDNSSNNNNNNNNDETIPLPQKEALSTSATAPSPLAIALVDGLLQQVPQYCDNMSKLMVPLDRRYCVSLPAAAVLLRARVETATQPDLSPANWAGWALHQGVKSVWSNFGRPNNNNNNGNHQDNNTSTSEPPWMDRLSPESFAWLTLYKFSAQAANVKPNFSSSSSSSSESDDKKNSNNHHQNGPDETTMIPSHGCGGWTPDIVSLVFAHLPNRIPHPVSSSRNFNNKNKKNVPKPEGIENLIILAIQHQIPLPLCIRQAYPGTWDNLQVADIALALYHVNRLDEVLSFAHPLSMVQAIVQTYWEQPALSDGDDSLSPEQLCAQALWENQGGVGQLIQTLDWQCQSDKDGGLERCRWLAQLPVFLQARHVLAQKLRHPEQQQKQESSSSSSSQAAIPQSSTEWLQQQQQPQTFSITTTSAEMMSNSNNNNIPPVVASLFRCLFLQVGFDPKIPPEWLGTLQQPQYDNNDLVGRRAVEHAILYLEAGMDSPAFCQLPWKKYLPGSRNDKNNKNNINNNDNNNLLHRLIVALQTLEQKKQASASPSSPNSVFLSGLWDCIDLTQVPNSLLNAIPSKILSRHAVLQGRGLNASVLALLQRVEQLEGHCAKLEQQLKQNEKRQQQHEKRQGQQERKFKKHEKEFKQSQEKVEYIR